MSRFTESKIAVEAVKVVEEYGELTMGELIDVLDRKSTRLNSSHRT